MNYIALPHESTRGYQQFLQKMWTSLQADSWVSLVEAGAHVPDEWIPSGLRNDWKPHFCPAIHVTDPILLLSLLVMQHNLVFDATARQMLDVRCRQTVIQIPPTENGCYWALRNNSWNLDAELADSVAGTTDLVRGRVIGPASTADFAICAADKAIEDGMDGVILIGISYDKTMATSKRSVYPCLIHLLNFVDSRAQAAQSLAICGMLTTTLHDDVVELAGQSELQHLQYARVVQSIDMVINRIEAFYDSGCVFQIGFGQAHVMRLRPVVAFVTIDSPDAHIFCGTLATWHYACLSHSSRAKASDSNVNRIQKMCVEPTNWTDSWSKCEIRSPDLYRAVYAACNAPASVGSNTITMMQQLQQRTGIHCSSRRAVQLTATAMGLRGEESSLKTCIGARVGADPLHQILHGIVKALFENTIVLVFYSCVLTQSQETRNGYSIVETSEGTHQDESTALFALLEEAVQTQAGIPDASGCDLGGRTEVSGANHVNLWKRKRVEVVDSASTASECGRSGRAKKPTLALREAVECAAFADDATFAANSRRYTTSHEAISSQQCFRCKASAAKSLQEFDRRARVAFKHIQLGGQSRMRSLLKKLSSCSNLQARDYSIILTGLPSIIGFNGKVIFHQLLEILLQLLIAQLIHIISLSYEPVFGGHTSRHLIALAKHIRWFKLVWNVLFPMNVLVQSATGRRVRFYSTDTLKMHGLVHIPFHIVSKGRLKDHDTNATEAKNAYAKAIFKSTSRSMNEDVLRQQMLDKAAVRLLHEVMANNHTQSVCLCYLVNL